MLLEKEKELLFGTIKAWTDNITFMYVCLYLPTYTHIHECVCLHVSHVGYVCMAGRQAGKRDDITSHTLPLYTTSQA